MGCTGPARTRRGTPAAPSVTPPDSKRTTIGEPAVARACADMPSMPNSKMANRPTGPAPMMATSQVWRSAVMARPMAQIGRFPQACAAAAAVTGRHTVLRRIAPGAGPSKKGDALDRCGAGEGNRPRVTAGARVRFQRRNLGILNSNISIYYDFYGYSENDHTRESWGEAYVRLSDLVRCRTARGSLCAPVLAGSDRPPPGTPPSERMTRFVPRWPIEAKDAPPPLRGARQPRTNAATIAAGGWWRRIDEERIPA